MGELLAPFNEISEFTHAQGFTDSSPMPLADYRLVDTVAALLHTSVYPCATTRAPRDLLASYPSYRQWI